MSGGGTQPPAAGFDAGRPLLGRVCLVTGAGAGIGRETALEMARQGAAAVVASDLDEDRAVETAALVDAEGAKGVGVACDVSSEDAVAAMIERTVDDCGRLDVLHNNAGIHETGIADDVRIEELDVKVFDKVYDVNLKGVFLTTKHAIPQLRRSRSAAIVNASSLSGLVGFEGAAAYCATKAAVIALTRVTALELAADGIRCNCYCPGAADTEMARGYIENAPDPKAAAAMLVQCHLDPRMAAPVEIARLVCFLASDASSFINGAAVPIEAGALAWRGVH